MKVQFSFKMEAKEISAKAYTEHMRSFAAILLRIHPTYAKWYMAPNGPKDVWVPLDDGTEFTAKIERENPPGELLIATITNCADSREWRKPGRTVLTFIPSQGIVRLEISEPDAFWGDKFFSTMKDVLRAFALEQWIEWASLDCSTKARNQKGEMETFYLSIDHRTFPHREFLGWMGWIQQLPPKKLLQASDLPMAAEVHSLPGRSGSIVVSVGEAFDITNPAHIEKMQRVEVRLVKLDLLPVIDPELM